MDLKACRESRKLTQSDLADLTGLGQSHLAGIETGKMVPRKGTRQKIEQVLGRRVDWISTLAQDRSHIGHALIQLLNHEEPGIEERIKFSKQYLNALDQLIMEETDNETPLYPTGFEVPETTTPDEAQEILYPTSPPVQDTSGNDEPLLPLMDT
jgi:transcriptional regulator with XRE-family HTH domain